MYKKWDSDSFWVLAVEKGISSTKLKKSAASFSISYWKTDYLYGYSTFAFDLMLS